MTMNSADTLWLSVAVCVVAHEIKKHWVNATSGPTAAIAGCSWGWSHGRVIGKFSPENQCDDSLQRQWNLGVGDHCSKGRAELRVIGWRSAFQGFLSGVMIIRASHSHCHGVIDSDMDRHMTSNCFHLPVLELNVSFSAPKNWCLDSRCLISFYIHWSTVCLQFFALRLKQSMHARSFRTSRSSCVSTFSQQWRRTHSDSHTQTQAYSIQALLVQATQLTEFGGNRCAVQFNLFFYLCRIPAL